MVSVKRHTLLILLVLMFLYPFVFNTEHWLFVHMNIGGALAILVGCTYQLAVIVVGIALMRQMKHSEKSGK